MQHLVDAGLAIIFISHKLGEVLAASNRVLVLRGGKLVGTRETAKTNREELASLMVGEDIQSPTISPINPGETVLELSGVSSQQLHDISLKLQAGTITGLAGVSGNGQAALANLISGLAKPSSGSMAIMGRKIEDWSPRQALEQGIGRIPEDRHHTGTIADMSITENVMLENYTSAELSSNGILNWRAACDQAQKVIDAYDVKCPSADAAIRLLSGGNMQKLILGRALGANPRLILANQPTRGLDVGAVAYVHERLIEARDKGAAILLISEDLDELLTLADTIHVIFRGRLSKAIARQDANLRQIGELMAGGQHAA